MCRQENNQVGPNSSGIVLQGKKNNGQRTAGTTCTGKRGGCEVGSRGSSGVAPCHIGADNVCGLGNNEEHDNWGVGGSE